MPTQDLSVLNPPPANMASSAAFAKYNTQRMQLADGSTNPQRQVCMISYKTNHRPVTISFSSTANVTLEITTSLVDIINGLVLGQTPIWQTITITSPFMIIDAPLTGIRITNSDSSALIADII